MSDFSKASKVTAVLDATETVERLRGENRDKINRALNGFPPLTAEAAKKIGLKINVNWLEEAVIAKQATLQFSNAFLSQNNYFNVQIPSAPPEKQSLWELTITDAINRPLKQSREFASLMDNRFTSIIAHGIAPQIWLSEDKWLPDFVAINDFRVATDTETSLKNMVWFGVRRRYTIGELVERVFGKYASPGWDKKAVIKILADYWDKNFEEVTYDWTDSPEKMTELIKQNMIFYTSDAVPVITLWHFYHLDQEKSGKKWLLKVVPDKSVRKADRTAFLFDSDEPVACCLDQLIHIQFGDLNGTPPFMYHSVRSLGFMLHEPCYWMNLTRCRTLQYTWENFNMLLRGGDGGDRARAQKVELFDKGWIPNDVTIVPREQRHQIDPNMVEMMLGQMKQLMGEASLSYTQKTDTGTQRERTLGEAQIQLQQANALMSGLLNVASRNEVFAYREICRRFCNKKSLDPDVRKFWKKVKAVGIPANYLNAELWDIHPDTPLGNGNQTLQMAQASQLMSVRGAHSPDAQQTILHLYDAAITQNPRLAQKLVPLGEQKSFSNGQAWASATFGTLMQGVPLPIKPELNPIDQIETLLGLSAGVIQKIETTNNVGSEDELLGLQTVMGQVEQLIQMLSQDPAQKDVVKQATDSLSQLSNIVKGFAQRQAQAAKASTKETVSLNYKDAPEDIKRQIEQAAGFQPSQLPVTDPKMLKAGQQIALKEEQFKQKSAHADAAFAAEQHRMTLETQAEIQKAGLEHGVKMAATEREAAAAEPVPVE